jgi:hypothetical protein
MDHVDWRGARLGSSYQEQRSVAIPDLARRGFLMEGHQFITSRHHSDARLAHHRDFHTPNRCQEPDLGGAQDRASRQH